MDPTAASVGIPRSQFEILCALDFGLQWTVFIISSLWRTEKLFDITGSITFIILTFLSFNQSIQSVRQQLQAFLVATWATRLGLYLFIRVLKSGQDRRFNKIKHNDALFFFTWTLQGVWVIVTLFPTLLLMSKRRDVEFKERDFIGYSLWTLGFCIEVVADFQKTLFRTNPSNTGKFITNGLWSLSRHPNYLGEILLWFGLYLSASSVFIGKETIAVICPILNMIMITKLSGIPPLEKYGLKKWGNDPKYREYLAKTAILIPYIW